MLSKTIQERLEKAGITINGPNAWDIQVYDKNGKRVPLNDKEKELIDMKVHLI